MAEIKPVQIDVSKVVPIFADEVMVLSRVKGKKKGDGNREKVVDKEAHIELVFLDQLSQPARAVSRIVVSKNTAAGLQKILADNVSKLEAEMKSTKTPKNKKSAEKPEVKNRTDYLG